MMWQPNRSQWVVICAGFVLSLVCFMRQRGSYYIYRHLWPYIERDQYLVLAIFVLVGAGLLVLWLEGRRGRR